MRIAQKIAFLSLLFFTVLLSSFLPSNSAHADVLSIGVKPKWTNWAAQWQYLYNYDNGNSGWIESSANTLTASLSLRVAQIRFSLPNGLVLQNGDYITAEMVYNLEDQNNSNDMIFGAMKSGTSGVGLVDVSVTRGSNEMGSIKFTFKVEDTIRVTNTSTYVVVNSARGSASQYNIFWFNEASGYIQGSIVNFYGTESVTDYSGGISSLNTGVTNLNSKLNTTNQKLDDLKNATEQANDDANDRYQDEKDTTYQEAQDGQDSMENGFSLPGLLNPLNNWLGYFKNTCSVDISAIRGWLGAGPSTYTSWWCQNSTMSNIRTNLTAILSVSGVMLVFGFAFKWLRTNNGED